MEERGRTNDKKGTLQQPTGIDVSSFSFFVSMGYENETDRERERERARVYRGRDQKAVI